MLTGRKSGPCRICGTPAAAVIATTKTVIAYNPMTSPATVRKQLRGWRMTRLRPMTAAALRAWLTPQRAVHQVSSGPTITIPIMVSRKPLITKVAGSRGHLVILRCGATPSSARPISSASSDTQRGAVSRRSREAPSGPMSARRVRHQATTVAASVVTTTQPITTGGPQTRSPG